jgi:ribosomal protein L16 Arg81 hydroxylase
LPFKSNLQRYIQAGDALYLPAYWWHHVKPGSTGRNLAVNFWYPTVSAMLRVAMDGMENEAF